MSRPARPSRPPIAQRLPEAPLAGVSDGVTTLDLAPLVEAVAARVVELLDERAAAASPAADAPEYLTVGEAGARLRVASKTVCGYVRDGLLPAVEVGGRLLVAADDLARFVEDRRVVTRPMPGPARTPRARRGAGPMGAAVARLDERRVDGHGAGA